MQPRWHPKPVVSKWLRSKATCRIPFLYNVFDFRVEPHSRNFYSFDREIPHFHVHFYGFQRIPWQIHLPWPSLICCASAMGFRIRLIYSGKQMRRLDLMNFGQFVHCWTWSERWKTHEQVVSWRFLVMGNERKVIVWLSVTLPCNIFRWWVWVSDHLSTFFPSSSRWCQAWHTVGEGLQYLSNRTHNAVSKLSSSGDECTLNDYNVKPGSTAGYLVDFGWEIWFEANQRLFTGWSIFEFRYLVLFLLLFEFLFFPWQGFISPWPTAWLRNSKMRTAKRTPQTMAKYLNANRTSSDVLLKSWRQRKKQQISNTRSQKQLQLSQETAKTVGYQHLSLLLHFRKPHGKVHMVLQLRGGFWKSPGGFKESHMSSWNLRLKGLKDLDFFELFSTFFFHTCFFSVFFFHDFFVSWIFKLWRSN